MTYGINSSIKATNIVTQFDGSGISVNSVVKLAQTFPMAQIDLLYIGGASPCHTGSFPDDVIGSLKLIAPQVRDCYSCDGKAVKEYIDKDPYLDFDLGMCEKCSLTNAVVLSHFIKEKSYDKLLHCGPMRDDLLLDSAASVILGLHYISRWDYPILDHGIRTNKLHKHCCPSIVSVLDMEYRPNKENIESLYIGLQRDHILETLEFRKEEYEVLTF